MLQYILFDLDNTLYPKSLGIFDLVVERIRNYMEVRMGFEKGLALELRQKYLRLYGSTLRGLMIHHKIDPGKFLDYVHDVGVEHTVPSNPDLGRLLKSIPIDRAIFTSGHRPYALKVLRCLGVEQHFPRIFDIISTQYIPKPNPEPYLHVLGQVKIAGERCLIIDDMPANLKAAKDLGMATVLVDQKLDGVTERIDGFIDYGIGNILELAEVLKKMEIPVPPSRKRGQTKKR